MAHWSAAARREPSESKAPQTREPSLRRSESDTGATPKRGPRLRCGTGRVHQIGNGKGAARRRPTTNIAALRASFEAYRHAHPAAGHARGFPPAPHNQSPSRDPRSAIYDAVARRPNASGARSDNQAGALPSIQRCASCCVTKPATCSRLPLGQATRTYHPEADLRGRASNAGFVLTSSTRGTSRKM
jgi:hypothetical protein